MHIKNINIEQDKYELASAGYLRINNFLTEQYAESIFKCLMQDVNWGISCYVNDEPRVFENTSDVDQLSMQVRKKLEKIKHEGDFQFIYNTYMMVTAYKEQRNPTLFLNRVLEWLNSQNTLNYFKQLTGNNSIIKMSAQATRYLPGHYLTQHIDIHSQEARQYAYVMGFSKDWNPDWGGLLHILNKEGNIVKTMIPEYNSLSIFKVPQNHFVSVVTPLAQTQRLAITGWLQAK
jgi:Rps23 Pro-64 3,4-dihydroxylase Tpa1-like proline 4-hydroxylase